MIIQSVKERRFGAEYVAPLYRVINVAYQCGVVDHTFYSLALSSQCGYALQNGAISRGVIGYCRRSPAQKRTTVNLASSQPQLFAVAARAEVAALHRRFPSAAELTHSAS